MRLTFALDIDCEEYYIPRASQPACRLILVPPRAESTEQASTHTDRLRLTGYLSKSACASFHTPPRSISNRDQNLFQGVSVSSYLVAAR